MFGLLQLVIGLGLPIDQERVQMEMYSILASPLLATADLRNISQASKKLLLNKRVLKINQDPLGIQGKRIYQVTIISVFFTI
jgi:hypothetical protein